ncbi:MAG: tol-pal system protein YbgF [Sideroxydans sp.]|nr:tol-pal system protein YbgF [Sideroxydans sp.]
MKRTTLIVFCTLLTANSPAFAGLFADDDARDQVKKLEARVEQLEVRLLEVDDQNKQAVRSLLNLQAQFESQSLELRKLQGQNEEWMHGLQNAEKRQKDFYVDLDARLHQIEIERQAEVAKPAANAAEISKGVKSNEGGETRAFDLAYGLYKTEKYKNAAVAFRDFLRQYPETIHAANVYYWMGNAYLMSLEYANAVEAYQTLLSKHADHPRVAEAMLNMVECYVGLKNKIAAKKTLKQIILQFPGSDAAEKARQRLATLK